MNLATRYRDLQDPLRAERKTELVLVVLVVLFLLQLLWGGFRAIFPSSADPVLPREASLRVNPAQELSQVDPDLRAEIVSRPLFWATRRPLVVQSEADLQAAKEAKQQQAEEKKAGKIDGVKLAGIFGGGDTAGIIALSKGKKHRLVIGQEIDGWKLDSVEPTAATFSSNGRTSQLQLKQVEIKASSVEVAEPDGQEAARQETVGQPREAGSKKRDKKRAEPEKGSGSSGGLTLGDRRRG